METRSAQQEILIFPSSDYIERLFRKQEVSEKDNKLTQQERIAAACWNGLVKDMLPELFMAPGNKPSLYIWQSREANFFISIEMGETPHAPDEVNSIDPYLFLPTLSEN